MKNKKNSSDISAYYKKKSVVSGYDTRRFSGDGGNYINLQEILPIIERVKTTGHDGLEVLELGAGRGRLTKHLLNSSLSVTCLEFSEAMVSILSQKFDQVQILHQSAFDTLKVSKKFEIITALRFFEHFSLEDQEKIIRNLVPSLTDSGRIIIPTMNPYSLEYVFSMIFPYGRYNYFYTRNEYRQLAEKVGFEESNYQTAFFIPRGIFIKVSSIKIVVSILIFIDKLFLQMFPNWGGYQYIELRRA